MTWPVADPVVAVLSAGSMGAAIGGVLRRDGGLHVVTALDGRSTSTRRRAAVAGLEDRGRIDAVVAEADIVLSIVHPSAAHAIVTQVADAMEELHRRVVLVECNAIAPREAVVLAERIRSAGGMFVDAAIQSPPPQGPGALLYVAGPDVGYVEVLGTKGLDVRILDGPVGQASAADLVLGGMVKVIEAAAVEVLLVARQWGLEDLVAERVPRLVAAVEPYASLMPSRARRWADELRSTGEAVHELGLPGTVFVGAADLLDLVASTSTATRPGPPGATHREVLDEIGRELEVAGRLVARSK